MEKVQKLKILIDAYKAETVETQTTFNRKIRPHVTEIKNYLFSFQQSVETIKATHSMACKELELLSKQSLPEADSKVLATLKKELLEAQNLHDQHQNLWSNVIGAGKNFSGVFRTAGAPSAKRLRVEKE